MCYIKGENNIVVVWYIRDSPWFAWSSAVMELSNASHLNRTVRANTEVLAKFH